MTSPFRYRRSTYLTYGILLFGMLIALAFTNYSMELPAIATIAGAVAVILAWIAIGLLALLGVFLMRRGRAGKLAYVGTLIVLLFLVGSYLWSCVAQKRALDAIWQNRGLVEFSDRFGMYSAYNATLLEPWVPYLSRVEEARVYTIENHDICEKLTALDDLEFLKVTLLDGASASFLPKLDNLKRLQIYFRKDPDPGFVYIAQLSHLEELEVSGKVSVTDTGLSHLKSLTELKLLTIYPSTITDRGIEALAHFRLERIHLDRSSITDEGLRLIEEMPLIELWIRDTKITNKGIQQLRQNNPDIDMMPAGLPDASEEAEVVVKLQELGFKLAADDKGRIIEAELTSLHEFKRNDSGETELSLDHITHLLSQLPELQKVRIDDLKSSGSSLVELAKLANLEELILLNAIIQDDEMASLTGLTSLRELNLLNSSVSDEGLAALGMLTKLENLNLLGTSIHGSGFEHLSRLKSLIILQLDGCPLENKELKHLAALPNLEWLSVDSTPVTDSGLKYLSRLPKLDTLILDNTKVTNAGLVSFAKAPAMERLCVRNTQVTPEGIAEFQESSPRSFLINE